MINYDGRARRQERPPRTVYKNIELYYILDAKLYYLKHRVCITR